MFHKNKPYNEVPLLCQERIVWSEGDAKIERRTRLRRIRRAFFGTIFSVLILAIAVFLLVGYTADWDYGIVSRLPASVFEYLFGGEINEDVPKESESPPQENESEHESENNGDIQDETLPYETEPAETDPTENDLLTLESLYLFEPSSVPVGEKGVIPMDLSFYSSGVTYINNSTGYSPDVNALLEMELGTNRELQPLSSKEGPRVLIIHTHGTEGYLVDGAYSYTDDGSEIARSDNKNENVVVLGERISEILNEYGINTAHCSFMHDSVGYRNSYARAAETIKEYLGLYPSIELVIDIHRDSIMRSTGELVRPVTLIDGEAVAQVMCVVGSDYNGDSCPNWQNNLSLALKLRRELNGEYTNLCRPTELRGYTYNQEYSKYSLLIEIGASGNSLNEASRAAELVAKALARIIKEN